MKNFLVYFLLLFFAIPLFSQKDSLKVPIPISHGISLHSLLSIAHPINIPFPNQRSAGFGFGLGYQVERNINARCTWSINPNFQYRQNEFLFSSQLTPFNSEPVLFERGVLDFQRVTINLPVFLSFYSKKRPLHFSIGVGLNALLAEKNEWNFDLYEYKAKVSEFGRDFNLLESNLNGGFQGKAFSSSLILGAGYNFNKWNIDLRVNYSYDRYSKRSSLYHITYGLVVNYKLFESRRS